MTTKPSYLDSLKDLLKPQDHRIESLVKLYSIAAARGGDAKPFTSMLGALNALRITDPKAGEHLCVTISHRFTRSTPRVEHDFYTTLRSDVGKGQTLGHKFMSIRYNYIEETRKGDRCLLTEQAKLHPRDPVLVFTDYMEDCGEPVEGLANCAMGVIHTLTDMGFITLTATASPQAGACTIIFINPNEHYRMATLTVDGDVLAQDRLHVESLNESR